MTALTPTENDAEPRQPRRRFQPSYFQVLFFVYMTLSLLIFTFLVPPFQKSDETAHFHRAVSLTNLDFFCSKDAKGEYFFPMKRKYAELPDVLHTFDVSFHYENKFDSHWLHPDLSDPKYNEEALVYRFCSLPIPGYLPNSLGILAGKLSPNPLVSFYLGRLFGALFFAAAVVFALRKVPDRYRPIIYLYAALPIVLHQVSAISYDAVQLSLFPLLFAYLTRFVTQDERIRPRDLLIFMALLLWVVNVRLFSYFPLLLLFLVIEHAKMAPTWPRYLVIAGGFFLVTGAITALFDLIYLPRAADSAPAGFGIDAAAQVQFVLHHPWAFFEACYNTMKAQRGEGLSRETVAVFGWIDYTLNYVPYYLFFALEAVVVYRTALLDRVALRPLQIFFLFATIALTALSLFFSLYAVWTPVGINIIDGLQGRYFLGLLPLSIFLISQVVVYFGRRQAAMGLLTIVGVVLLFNMYRAVMLRYY